MPTNIGEALREARLRHKIELAEVEADTKIRTKYLRALEQEEWDVLPAPAYTRGFLRTYANFLDLDADVLVDEYRRRYETPEAEPYAYGEPVLREPRRGASGESRVQLRMGRGQVVGVAVAGILVLLLVLGLTGGAKEKGGPATVVSAPGLTTKGNVVNPPPKPQTVATAQSEVKLAAEAEVWVCLVDDQGQKLIDGEVLGTGIDQGPFHARGFQMTFGNGSVRLDVNGKPVSVPPSTSPIGYAVTDGKVQTLAEADRPTCA